MTSTLSIPCAWYFFDTLKKLHEPDTYLIPWKITWTWYFFDPAHVKKYQLNITWAWYFFVPLKNYKFSPPIPFAGPTRTVIGLPTEIVVEHFEPGRIYIWTKILIAKYFKMMLETIRITLNMKWVGWGGGMYQVKSYSRREPQPTILHANVL